MKINFAQSCVASSHQHHQSTLLNRLLIPLLALYFIAGAGSLYGSYNDFQSNPYTTSKQKTLIEPYLLPKKAPVRDGLDAIFLKERVTVNPETFLMAGFEIVSIRPRSFIYVARHPQLPGYLVKVTLDIEKRQKSNLPAWQWLVKRCEGSKKIKNAIKKYKIKNFVVADEWIYPLPLSPAPPNSSEYERKNEILVVTDMELASEEDSYRAWRNMTTTHLDELYCIISTVGGRSYREDNIPLTKEGKFAFIDTEYAGERPDYNSVAKYLSPEMQKYWKRLVKHKASRLHKNRK